MPIKSPENVENINDATDQAAFPNDELIGQQIHLSNSFNWNDTGKVYSHHLCIHQIFEAQVLASPDSTAVVFEQNKLTYRELDRRANQVAHFLIEQGVVPDQPIGVCLYRSFEMVIAILGILKAGGAYLPLDPDFPDARIAFMMKDARLSIVLTASPLREKFNDNVHAVFMDEDSQLAAFAHHSHLVPEVLNLTSSHLAYIIYTSGSTGTPKGVMIEHRALVNRLEWMRNKYGCGQTDSILQKTPFSFDVSVWEFFLPLISGAKIVLAKPDGHRDPFYLSRLIQAERITKLHFVPSMLNASMTTTNLSEWTSVKQVFCSGESLPPHYVEKFFKQGTNIELHNLYGPTEAAIDVSFWHCSELDSQKSSVPIGKPIDNVQLYIVDEKININEQAAYGELYIGGAGLARGYLNRSDLTLDKFVANPFSNDPQSRLYKTGDICRRLSDGNIEFIGRMDHQVKIRGYRIELGEVEHALIGHELIEDAIVLSKDTHAETKALSAYIIAKSELDNVNINEYLRLSLPEYMLPSEYIFLTTFPVTANGKVDRNALLSLENQGGGIFLESMSFLQREIYKIWQKILGTNSFGSNDDLFVVGGDSIAAIQIMKAVNDEFLCNIDLQEMFSAKKFSITWLAELVERHQISFIGEDEYSVLVSQIENMSEEELSKLLSEQ